jgi:hypothetical protein
MLVWISIIDMRKIIFNDRITTNGHVRRPISSDPLISSLSYRNHFVLCNREFVDVLIFYLPFQPLLWLFLIELNLSYLYERISRVSPFVVLRYTTKLLNFYLVLRLKVPRCAVVLSLKSPPVLISLLTSDGLPRDV